MEILDSLLYISKLKSVKRFPHEDVSESSADHSWSALVLAQYFLKKISRVLDENRVFKLVLYHDLVEVETGDVALRDVEAREKAKQIEHEAAQVVAQKLPIELRDEFLSCFHEFEQNVTWEAKFANAIDRIEPFIFWHPRISEWKGLGFTKDVLYERQRSFLEPFPEILTFYDSLLDKAIEKGYF